MQGAWVEPVGQGARTEPARQEARVGPGWACSKESSGTTGLGEIEEAFFFLSLCLGGWDDVETIASWGTAVSLATSGGVVEASAASVEAAEYCLRGCSSSSTSSRTGHRKTGISSDWSWNGGTVRVQFPRMVDVTHKVLKHQVPQSSHLPGTEGLIEADVENLLEVSIVIIIQLVHCNEEVQLSLLCQPRLDEDRDVW